MVLHTRSHEDKCLKWVVVDLLELEYMWKIVCCSVCVIDSEARRQTVSPVCQFVAHLTCKVTQLSQTFQITDTIRISEQCQSLRLRTMLSYAYSVSRMAVICAHSLTFQTHRSSMESRTTGESVLLLSSTYGHQYLGTFALKTSGSEIRTVICLSSSPTGLPTYRLHILKISH